MDLNLSSEQAALDETLRAFLGKESPTDVVRAAEPLGFDPRLWRKVAELGLPEMAVPGEFGGGDGTLLDLAVAAQCIGHYLAPVPLIEAGVANRLLARLVGTGGAGDEVIEKVLSGEGLATIAPEPAANGRMRLVPAGAVSDAVLGLDEDRLVLVIQPDIGPDCPGRVIPNLGSCPVGHCEVREDQLIVVDEGPGAVAGYRRAVSEYRALTACALAGAGYRAIELAADYVLQRRAFGTLIGSFQSVQHRLAWDVTVLDGTWLLAYEAAWACDADTADAERLARMASLHAAEAAFRASADSLHVHGGYGYTLEYEIQLYFRRTKAWGLLAAGDPEAGYAALARELDNGSDD
ncbi:acyl-CoA dehydrogenase family protein [Nocardia macrotermitis]|uniref:Acyl-CoA dehydrogenase FadE27 n=1 Tax=Nocardia macrotermitis TaxID=2585198 RepID=A0A7K0DF69_9NOCA|nr:acyl-CoA dehydrogenase family protein [Nocardia macrotermitis]MQY24328.1 Acyl-CoA dehydrogenase FadE27 [Nocardia macrotermitis]